MRVFVTGVGGFVGRHLARFLRERGDCVSGSYVGAVPDVPGAELYPADLLETAALRDALRRANPDAVVHLAGLSHVGESWQRPGDYFRVNVEGTESLLDAAAGLRVLLASSAEVYGPVPADEQPIDEERPADPRTPYALTKAAAERLALRRDAIVVRAFNVIGAGQAPVFALPAFAARLAGIRRGEHEPVLRVGNLSARRDFVHVADAVAGLALLITRGERRAIYNLARGEALSIAEALERLLAIAGVEVRIEVDPERMRPVDNPLLCGNAAKLRGLGWVPGHSFDQALADLWRSLNE
jgi:GDP-4-dehydro-6-deoxy-D-mannose reductase